MLGTKGVGALALVLIGAALTFASLGSGGSTDARGILVSRNADRLAPRALKGFQATGRIYVFLGEVPSVKRVRYYLDDPQMARRALRVTARPPYDLVGRDVRGKARPFDTTALAHGRHRLTAAVELADGKTRTVNADFSAPHLFVAASASDTSPCSETAPCGSFDRAYDLARPGQIVDVAPGTYRGQTITGSKSGPEKVVLRLDPSSVVPELYIEADNLEIHRGKISYWEARADSDGFTARGVDANLFGIYGSSNTSVIGGDVGPSYAPGGVSSPVFITVGTAGDARNILIDGVLFHDFRAGQQYQHLECIQIVAVAGLTIRNSRFQRCDIYSLFFTQWAGPNPPHDILLENNWFDESTADGQYGQASYAVAFASHMTAYSNIALRYNSFKQPFVFDGNSPRTNVQVIGNLGVSDGCDPRITYSHNVWQWDSRSAACSATDRVVIGKRYSVDRLGFVDPATLDLRLSPKSPAIDRGDPQAYPRRDIFGTRRPVGRRPDAGATEAR